MMISSIFFCCRILKPISVTQLRIQYLHMAHPHTNAIYLNRIEIFHIESEFVDFNMMSLKFISYLYIDRHQLHSRISFILHS